MPLLELPAQRPDPLQAAQRVVAARYGGAECVFLGGAVLGSERTANSDLDLVVIGEHLGAPYRETFVAEGWPVEAFVHDRDSWAAYRDKELRERRIAITAVVAEGEPLVDRGGGAALAAEARALLDAGPAPLTHGEQESLRYMVMDTLLDLQACSDPAEQLLVAAVVVEQVVQLYCDRLGVWPARGKRLLRPLRVRDADAATQLAGALRAAAAGTVTPLIDAALEALDACGGRVYDGFRQAGRRQP